MRRMFFHLLAATVALASNAARAEAQRTFEIETRAGCAFAKFSGDIDAAHSKTGLAAGIAMHVPLSSVLSFQPELQYVSKGNSYGTTTDPVIDGFTYYGTYNELISLDYVEMPLLLRATFGEALIRPAFVAGPYVGLKVVEKYQLNGAADDPYASTEFGRTIDLGYAAGFALEMGAPERCLTLEARYSGSLLDIQKPEYPGDFGNRDFRVQIGWKQTWPPSSL